jgi:hypothetical protein
MKHWLRKAIRSLRRTPLGAPARMAERTAYRDVPRATVARGADLRGARRYV